MKIRPTIALIFLCLTGLLLVAAPAHAADSDDEIIAKINAMIRRGWEENGVTPSERAGDGEFARRVCLDVVGHIPSLHDLTGFLDNPAENKRRQLVDRLLDDSGYIKNWSTIWANILVGRANNRRTNRPALEKWLRDALHRNIAYNQFVSDLIAAEGDNLENGAANFLSAHLNDGAVPATAITARLFLGMQVQCTQCHNHPFNDWKQSQFWGLNAYFRGTRSQGGGTRGEFTLVDGPANEIVFFERRSGLEEAVARQFVDGSKIETPPNTTDKPRAQLARLITDPAKPFLAETEVNRMWGHFFGSGFTKPVDDMGPHNAPSHPDLLKYLGTEFARNGYDVKRLIRWITASEAYNLTSAAGESNKGDDLTSGSSPLFSRMYLKSFTAEQLYDSLIIATEAHRANRNEEAAENQRRQWLGQFIRTFGTDENDESTTFNGTIPQALVLMNGDLIRNATNGANGSFLRRLLEEDATKLPAGAKKSAGAAKPPAAKSANAKKSPPVSSSKSAQAMQKKIDALFLATLCRLPSKDELRRVDEVFQSAGTRDPIAGLQDLFWAILNSNEFIINH